MRIMTGERRARNVRIPPAPSLNTPIGEGVSSCERSTSLCPSPFLCLSHQACRRRRDLLHREFLGKSLRPCDGPHAHGLGIPSDRAFRRTHLPLLRYPQSKLSFHHQYTNNTKGCCSCSYEQGCLQECTSWGRL